MTDTQAPLIADNIKLIDRITNKYGYGLSVWKTFILAFMVVSLEGFHFTYFGNMIISLKQFYNMGNDSIEIINSIFFLAVGLGSLSGGFLTKYIKRVYLINVVLFILATCHVSLAFITNLVLFAIIRTVIAICGGIIVPLTLNLLIEYLPVYRRSVMLTSAWLGFTFGQLLNLVLMLIIMPNNEVNKYQETILYTSALSIVTFLLVLILLNDSPRNLLLTGDTEKAYLILDKLNGQPLTEAERERLENESSGTVKKESKLNVLELFNPNLRRISFLLIIIWMFNSILLYGPGLVSSLTMAGLGLKDDDLIVNQIIIAILAWPSDFIGGLASEIPFLGRNKTCSLSLLMAIVFNILLMINWTNFQIHFGIFIFFINITVDVSKTYAAEVYPTNVRDVSMGFLYCWKRIGGFISQIVFLEFFDWGLWVPYYATLVICVLAIICFLFLPFDTHSRPLDKEISEQATTAPSAKAEDVL
jgi:AAHS family benzoate transporter-like MFS transporter